MDTSTNTAHRTIADNLITDLEIISMLVIISAGRHDSNGLMHLFLGFCSILTGCHTYRNSEPPIN